MNSLNLILNHLQFLVQQDTTNPPRLISKNDPLFTHLSAHFIQEGFEVRIQDYGLGRVAFWAQRGHPQILFNVHLDTVPIEGEWTHDPLDCTVSSGKVYGRGVCDIKGAAACLMALAEETQSDMAVLFTTDEEGTNSCCVNSFLDESDLTHIHQVIVAEPTKCKAVANHRGYVSAQGVFKGDNGHSSSSNALFGNAIHRMTLWLFQALDEAKSHCNDHNPSGICFNTGVCHGGTKNNMIASDCSLSFSFRAPSGVSSHSLYNSLTQSLHSDHAEWKLNFLGPSLPENLSQSESIESFCQKHLLETSESVDFWTEASLFSQKGLPAIVLGPGDIEQAHTVDEWVSLEQLTKCYHIYKGVIS
jgi:acetylornithine deacetylase